MAANRVSGPYLRLMFGIFVTGLGLTLIYSEISKIG